MKKLMIAAAIVCAAAFSQAAQFSWGFHSDEIMGPDAAHSDGDGYLLGGYATLFIGGVQVATATMGDDLMFGVFDDSAIDTTGKVQTLDDGDIDFVGQAYKLVLRTEDDKFEIVYTSTSKYDSVSPGVGIPDKHYEQFVVGTAYQASDWKAVPEPTSGLLLLLGVAGLALKRKRA